MTNLLSPHYVWGYISPLSVDAVRRDGYEFYRLVPEGVMQIVVSLGGSTYTSRDQVERAIQDEVPRLVDRLVAENPGHLTLGGVPIAALAGRDRLRRALEGIEARTGVRANNPLEAAVAGFHHLGVRRVALGGRWTLDVNQAIGAYLADAGIELVGATERGHAPAGPVNVAKGIEMSLEVAREAVAKYPAAEAIFVPGGAALSLHVIPILEAEHGKPVLTNLTAEVWEGLVRPGIVPPITDWGTLLATP